MRRVDATPGDGLDPVVRIVEDLGTVEIPCGKWTAAATAIEYMVSAKSKRNDYTLAECKVSHTGQHFSRSAFHSSSYLPPPSPIPAGCGWRPGPCPQPHRRCDSLAAPA